MAITWLPFRMAIMFLLFINFFAAFISQLNGICSQIHSAYISEIT